MEDGVASKVLCVRGTAAPLGNVTVTTETSDINIVVPATTTLTLTPGNYATLQAVMITGLDENGDAEAAGFTPYSVDLVTASTDDPDYNNRSASLDGFNVDNDQCRVLLLPPTATGDRLQLETEHPAPFLAMITANPPVSTQVNAVFEQTSGPTGYFTGSESLTFSTGATPQVRHLYGGAAGAVEFSLSVDGGDACYSLTASPGTAVLYGTAN